MFIHCNKARQQILTTCCATLIGKYVAPVILLIIRTMFSQVLPMAAMATACHMHFRLRSMITHTQRVPEMARTLQPYDYGVHLLMTLMMTECTGFVMENVSRRKQTQHSLLFHVAGRAALNIMVFLDFMFEHEVLYDSPTICSNTLHFICYSSQADAKTLLQSQQS